MTQWTCFLIKSTIVSISATAICVTLVVKELCSSGSGVPGIMTSLFSSPVKPALCLSSSTQICGVGVCVVIFQSLLKSNNMKS